MSTTLTEDAPETPDGVLRVFSTGTEYAAGSVRVFVNGQLKRGDYEDGWTELGGRLVELDEAPKPEDSVAILYRTKRR